MIVIDSSQVNTEMEDLFSIDGRTYSIPKEPSGSLALEFLDRARKHGELSAIGWIMETLLTLEGYDALRKCPAVTGPQLQAIVKIVTSKVTGMLEEEGKG